MVLMLKLKKIDGFELIYTSNIADNHSLNISGYRNIIDVIAWNGDINKSEQVGTLKLFGIEADYRSNYDFGNLGLNYSFIKQTDWSLASGVNGTGISYSDYNQVIGDGLQTGFGNDLANWPNHILKFYGQFSISEKLKLNINSRILWDFQGTKDGLTGLEFAVKGTEDENAVRNSLRIVEDSDAYDLDFRSNLSVSFRLRQDIEASIFILNVLGVNNYRYSYDNGNDDPAPTAIRFVKEPRVIGIKFNYGFKIN